MNPTIQSSAARRALTSGLVAGTWLMLSAVNLSAATPGVEATSPADAASDVAVPDLIQLAQADAVPAETPVSFSSDQADRGEERYTKDCEECHGDDLKGGMNGGAPIRGLSFEQKYAEGAPASWLFEYMSTEMPPNSPGRYSASTYADLMAYVLKRNGFQTGAPLPSDIDALENLMMAK